MDFAAFVDHTVKLKEREKKDKYLTLLKNWKSCGAWKWRFYLLYLVLLVQSPEDW